MFANYVLTKINQYNHFIFFFILNFVIFHQYWLGVSTPPWDFLGGGMVEQYRFYKDGSFFNPPSWFPYAWFGIPEYQMVQDGGWFIPVMVTAELFGWHPANAARLQAFLILLGVIGMYKLAFTFVNSKYFATLAGALYIFIPVFYSNAQHYSSVRSAVFLPWLLYVVHPKNIRKSQFSILFGAIIIFQTIVGSYPGNLISNFYSVVIYIALICLQNCKDKINYFKSLILMSFAGVSMGLIRYLPVILLQESFPSNVGNQAGITTYNIPYLIFPFIGKNLPYEDPTLRSIYIGSLGLAVLFYFSRKLKATYPWLVMTLLSVIMMMWNEFNTLIRETVPYLNISRFAITDWRNLFNLSIIMIITYILMSLSEFKYSLNFGLRLSVLLVALIPINLVAFRSGQSLIYLIFYTYLIVEVFIALRKINLIKPYQKILSLIFVSVLGIIFVFQNSFAWMTTVKEQNLNIYNKEFTDVVETVKYPLEFRPERISFNPLPLTPDQYKNDQRYNIFWLTGEFGAYGYHNIKDIEQYAALYPRLEKNSDPIVSFLLSRSQHVVFDGSQNVEELISQCAFSSNCANDLGVEVTQKLFDKEREVFEISASTNFTIVQNEMYSPVWTGEICLEDECEKIYPVLVLDSLRGWELPSGNYTFETIAKTPLNTERWILFYFGLTLAFLSIGYKKFNVRNLSLHQ
jgi:hypothetical protein